MSCRVLLAFYAGFVEPISQPLGTIKANADLKKKLFNFKDMMWPKIKSINLRKPHRLHNNSNTQTIGVKPILDA